MAVHLIPIDPSQPDVTFDMVLESVHYTMHVYWNNREVAWMFDLLDTTGTHIADGLKITLGCYIGRHVPAAPFTLGAFIAVDTSGDERDAGIDDLGTRVRLFYVPSADLITVLSTALGT